MTEDEVLCELIGSHILHVTINRPEKRNAINSAVAAGIDAAVERSENDTAIRAVVLSGAGDRSFSAGADLGEVAAGRMASLRTKDGGFAGLVEAKRKKPWIAAVDGTALGGGLEICLACDLVVASDRAIFGLPEVKRGIIAGAAGVFRLPQRIPPAISFEMLMTGEPIAAERAYSVGLINRLVPAGQAVAAAMGLAAEIAGNAPLAVQQSLMLARSAQDLDENTLFDAMRRASALVQATDDAHEGVQAFTEKRKPVWSGR